MECNSGSNWANNFKIARALFEISSTITPCIVRRGTRSPVINYYKIREDGSDKMFIALCSFLVSSFLIAGVQLSSYKVSNHCPQLEGRVSKLSSGLFITNHIREFYNSYD